MGSVPLPEDGGPFAANARGSRSRSGVHRGKPDRQKSTSRCPKTGGLKLQEDLRKQGKVVADSDIEQVDDGRIGPCGRGSRFVSGSLADTLDR